jgi:hypothetical protein
MAVALSIFDVDHRRRFRQGCDSDLGLDDGPFGGLASE